MELVISPTDGFFVSEGAIKDVAAAARTSLQKQIIALANSPRK
jgi:hypothetical protein